MDIEFNKNEDANSLLVSKMQMIKNKVALGGGQKKIDKQHAKGKLTARERIEYLQDKDSTSLEIGSLAGFEMYENYGGCPSGGVIVKLIYIHGIQCIVVANDATVKAGAWFPITGKKNLRAQEIAIENQIPIIYLVDSAGVFLPMQDEIFPDKENFGRIFRNNAVMSSMGIVQISAIMGSCVAGGAYLPIMSDESIIVKGTGSIFLAGPYLVKAAIGETVDKETLGGAETQSTISGVTDYIAENDQDALDKIKSIFSHINLTPTLSYERKKAKKPSKDISNILGSLPSIRTKPYHVKDIIDHIVDADSLEFYKEDYGKTMLCAYAKIDGFSIGIVANNREVVKNGKGEMQFGGVIYSDCADKATRFILNCNQKRIPLLFMHDVTGFMVGKRSEHGGIIKDGAKMVNAVSNSTVPKFTIIIGNSYGAGNYAMCGKAYDPRLIFAWPSAKIAVMGGAQAAKVMAQIEIQSKKAKGETFDEDEKANLINKIQSNYDRQTTPYYAAARLWIDDIIDPRDTRKVLIQALEMSSRAEIKKFNVGVIQT